LIVDAGYAAQRGAAQELNTSAGSVAQQWATETQIAEKGRLYVVAQDLSDAPSAETSRHAITRLSQLYYAFPSNNHRASLQDALRRVNNELLDEGRRHQTHKCVVLAAAAVQGRRCIIANIGLTAASLVRGSHLGQLTPAHTWEEAYPKGADDEEDLPPARSLGRSSRALADYVSLILPRGSYLLLSTSGVPDGISETEVQEVLANAESAQLAAEKLASIADEHQVCQNCGVAVLSVAGKGGPVSKLPPVALYGLYVAGGAAIVAIGALLLSRPNLGEIGAATRTQAPAHTATIVAQGSPTVAELAPTEKAEPTSAPSLAPPSPALEPATSIAQATRPPTATAAAAATSTPATELANIEKPPWPIAPYQDEPVYQGDNSVLVWQWHRKLGPEEVYAVRIWKDGEKEPESATALVGGREHRFGLPLDQAGKQHWNVAVMGREGGVLRPVSASSETKTFWWMGPRRQDTAQPPTNTPVPPTATPIPPTSTSAPPSATPVPPTNTPIPPTNTPLPPTDTPVPPTPTPLP
jgi:serine/threonine protein phosphatase PrpC